MTEQKIFLDESHTDEILVSRYALGEQEAFDELVRRYTPLLYSFVYHRLGNSADAQDVVQAIFIKAWRSIAHPFHFGGAYDPEKGTFKTWIYSIAKNAVLDALKKKREFPFAQFEDESGVNMLEESLADPELMFEKIADKDEAQRAFETALTSLDQKQKTVLLLRYVDGLSFKEIGERLSEPLDTVKSRHRRAITALKRFYASIGIIIPIPEPKGLV